MTRTNSSTTHRCFAHLSLTYLLVLVFTALLVNSAGCGASYCRPAQPGPDHDPIPAPLLLNLCFKLSAAQGQISTPDTMLSAAERPDSMSVDRALMSDVSAAGWRGTTLFANPAPLVTAARNARPRFTGTHIVSDSREQDAAAKVGTVSEPHATKTDTRGGTADSEPAQTHTVAPEIIKASDADSDSVIHVPDDCLGLICITKALATSEAAAVRQPGNDRPGNGSLIDVGEILEGIVSAKPDHGCLPWVENGEWHDPLSPDAP